MEQSTKEPKNIWRRVYQHSRGILTMGDSFMEPWEYEYAERVVREI